MRTTTQNPLGSFSVFDEKPRNLQDWLVVFSGRFPDINRAPVISFQFEHAARSDKSQSMHELHNGSLSSISDEEIKSNAASPIVPTAAQPQEWLCKLQSRFRDFITEKEELTKANVTATERRGRTRGYVTSIWPPIGISKWMHNYATKKGVLYKAFHPSEAYARGQNVFFSAAQNFYGAKIKGLRTKKSDEYLVEARMRNIGFSEAICREIDYENYQNNKEITVITGVKTCKEIMDHLLIKSNLEEFDEYFDLLKNVLEEIKKNNPSIYEEADLLCKMNALFYLDQKSEYLSTLSKETVFDDFQRGLDYSFESFQRSGIENPIEFIASLQPQKIISQNPDTTSTQYFDSSNRTVIPLDTTKRIGDILMNMDLDSGKYNDFKISGVTHDKKLIGKQREVLRDGWYQFVIMANVQEGQPEIRYFPCGDRKKDEPFTAQPIVSALPTATIFRDGKTYQIQYPVKHSLKYNKYIAHSQLAGGEPVISGGAFMIRNGQLRVIEDSSGHYGISENSPTKYDALITARDAFDYLGVDTSDTILERWEPCAPIDKILKKVAGLLCQPFSQTTLTQRAGISDRLAESRSAPPAYTGAPTRPRTTIQLLHEEQKREMIIHQLSACRAPKLDELRNMDLSELDLSQADIRDAQINARTHLKGATLSSQQINLLYDKGIRVFEEIKIVNHTNPDGTIVLIRPDVFQCVTFKDIVIPIEQIQTTSEEDYSLSKRAIKTIDISKCKENIETLGSLLTTDSIKISAKQAIELNERNCAILEKCLLDREEFKTLLKKIDFTKLTQQSLLLTMIQRECARHNMSPGAFGDVSRWTLSEKKPNQPGDLKCTGSDEALGISVIFR